VFILPDTAPWGAVLVVMILILLIGGITILVRAVWPQESQHRKELLQTRQIERARERAERRLERAARQWARAQLRHERAEKRREINERDRR
jgi:hypothetical protein